MVDFDDQRVLLPFEYDTIGYLLPWHGYEGEHVGLVIKDGKYGTINENFEIQIPIEYDSIYIHREAEVIKVIQENEKYGLLDKYGKLLIDFKYDKIGYHLDKSYFICLLYTSPSPRDRG